MNTAPLRISALYAGKPQPLGPRRALSALVKTPHPQLRVHKDSTEEDEQANKRLHGGPEKVLHQYSPNAYAVIAEHYPHLRAMAKPGSIGENISVSGMHDDNVYIGDTYAFGELVLQVSAPRAPCNKINLRFNCKGLDQFVGNQGITGVVLPSNNHWGTQRWRCSNADRSP